MNFVRFAFTVLLSVSLTGTNAQVKPGYTFGMNLSTLTLKTNGIDADPEISPGVRFGGFLEIPVNNSFTFQPQFLFSAKGSTYNLDNGGVNIRSLMISAQYGMGLANISPSAATEMKNQVIGISISSSFIVK